MTQTEAFKPSAQTISCKKKKKRPQKPQSSKKRYGHKHFDRLMTWSELAGMSGRCTQPREQWTSIIYALLDPRDQRVRYVGFTTRTLAERLLGHMTSPTNGHMRDWMSNLRAAGLEPIARVITYAPPAFASAMELEWISKIRARAHLLNIDPGGHFRDSKGKPVPAMKRIAGMVQYQTAREFQTGGVYHPVPGNKFKGSKGPAASRVSHRQTRRALAKTTLLWGKITASNDTTHEPARCPAAGTLVQHREDAQATVLRRRNGEIRALSPNTSSKLASDPDKAPA